MVGSSLLFWLIGVGGGVLIAKAESVRTRGYRRERKDALVRIMGGKCFLCGYDKCSSALEFHHIDMSEKEFTFSMHNKSFSDEIEELKKCTLLCANCHREVHSGFYNGVEILSTFNSDIANKEIDVFNNKMYNPHKIKKRYICDCCGSELKGRSKTNLCKSCLHKRDRVCERPTREELKSLIRKCSFTKIGSSFGVSDNAVKKWCDNYSLPRTKREINKISDDDWEKI